MQMKLLVVVFFFIENENETKRPLLLLLLLPLLLSLLDDYNSCVWLYDVGTKLCDDEKKMCAMVWIANLFPSMNIISSMEFIRLVVNFVDFAQIFTTCIDLNRMWTSLHFNDHIVWHSFITQQISWCIFIKLFVRSPRDR